MYQPNSKHIRFQKIIWNRVKSWDNLQEHFDF